jgi:NAD-dependent deacetylase
MDPNVKPRIVVLTGAGISAESGIRTFRDSNGLWEEHAIEDVATPEAWARNPQLVTRFYNLRRMQLADVKPNAAHYALAKLESLFELTVITQNVDDLHERAGTIKLIHLHGELVKLRSVVNPNTIVNVGYREVMYGETCDRGTLLRPHIVWFGEAVPMIEKAAVEVSHADIVLIIGTSLNVYPAAGLMHYAPPHAKIYYIDPTDAPLIQQESIIHLQKTACEAVPKLVEELMDLYG